MNRQEFLEDFERLQKKSLEKVKAKNRDYAGGDDPFANFRLIEDLGVAKTELAIFTRMLDKVSRIASFLKSGELKVKDEKVEDTLADLADYCTIMIIFLQNSSASGTSSVEKMTSEMEKSLEESDVGVINSIDSGKDDYIVDWVDWLKNHPPIPLDQWDVTLGPIQNDKG